MTPDFGLVTGRVSSIAIDPADVSGNHVFVGTTGGGVWVSQNAASSGNVVFTPLTDSPDFSSVRFASISVGAVSVQPGGTGVILAGTGDPNDALDSYYGAGILRSADGGNTWTATSHTADQAYSFLGEGFAGFAWSTVNPQLVVAAVSQAYEDTLVSAQTALVGSAGLYYSRDAGATWSLATITDGPGQDVQGPNDQMGSAGGNPATAVVWNPVRQLFIAAVRFHGYYQSTDGITWTRMIVQPGSGLTPRLCPANAGVGSIACPIFRGALAVNPVTGDTFAWTVDLYNQDQGLWQDACAISGGNCSQQSIAFAQRWNTAPLEQNTSLGAVTIQNGDYNLALAAVPSGQDTLLLAGANDLWKCSLAMGCVWRNTTNASTCMSAQVAPYIHALAWNPANPQELLVGNDSGLWRSMDAIAESESVCSSSDATHFQNLNAGLGSLAEVQSMSQVGGSPYTMTVGLGVNGAAGVKSTAGPTTNWPQVLGGEGGPVAIDPVNPTNWYVNSNAGVSIYRCSESGDCTPDAFGKTPVVDDADVAGDGYTMTSPAAFIVDPLNHTELLVGTCRLWRGPADGIRWTTANAISPVLDGLSGLSYCSGDALIRSISALPIAGGGEVIYIGMYGSRNGGAILGGHVLRATFVPGASSMPSWQDLTLNPVSNEQVPFNYYGFDISSIFIDPHDVTGNTVYVTVAGIPDPIHSIRTLYRTTDGGAHWSEITSNLAKAPANSVVIDPQDANTAYVATDEGVYSTRQVASCVSGPSNCWSVFGARLPLAPVVQLSAAPPSTSPSVLVAGTYGRGIWQIPLWSAGVQLTTASAEPDSLSFAEQPLGTTSSAQTLTVTNSGAIALVVTSISASDSFAETDNCVNAAVNSGASCRIQVTFTPAAAGVATGQITINANISGGQITIPLSGIGTPAELVTASPSTLSFGQVQIGSTSVSRSVTIENAGGTAIHVASITVTPPFSVASNACGPSIAANSACALSVTFTPTQRGPATGSLTVTDDAGIQTVVLDGTGATAATDVLSPSSITFPATVADQLSAPQIATLTNNGDLVLTSITTTTSAEFQASNNCGGSLSAHASCAISVAFVPSATGTIAGTLTVSDAIRTQTITLSGTGLQPPTIGVSPAQLAFSTQPVGQTSNPITLTVSNTGGAAMANVGFQITGPDTNSFSWAASTCGATLAKASNCTVQLAFTPAAPGQLSATLTVSSSTSGVAPVQVPLTGSGQSSSGITISPLQMTFTQTTLAQPSAAQTATLSNASSTSATGLTLAISSPFILSQNTCGSTLASGASCTTGIVFTPTVNGVANGTLTVSSSKFVNAATETLVGNGGAAGSIQVQPASFIFPSTGVGVSSSAQTVTLTNNGPIALPGLTLLASTRFQLVSTTCSASLDTGASCTAQIAFAPTVAGQQNGSLTISSSSLATNAQLALSGMGFDFTISPSGQVSQTVSSGQTARYNLSVVPLNGSSGTFSLACSSLPANSSCTFNPASETVSANTTGAIIVQIATGLSTSTANVSHRPENQLLHMLPLACLLFALPAAFRRVRKTSFLLVIIGLALIGITSCAGAGGGGGGTPPPGSSNNNTPAGTYSVVVTATADGISHKTTLMLTVD